MPPHAVPPQPLRSRPAKRLARFKPFGYSLRVSALEVIEQIKALPPEEKAQVVDFVCQMAAPPPSISRVIRYASPEQVRAAAEKVFRKHEEVFRRLAQ